MIAQQRTVSKGNTMPNNDEPNEPNTPNTTPNNPANPAMDEKLLQEKIDEALKPIKENLDKAYAARDEALAKVASKDQADREAEVKRLEEEGKHKEAWGMKEAELNAQVKALTGRTVELTRDIDVKNSLSGLEFRHEKAAEMAFKEISTELIQNEAGSWKHKDGRSITEYAKAFSDDVNNSFLFKAKQNNGGGTPSPEGDPGVSDAGNGSVFEQSQSQVLEAAAKRLGQ